MDIQGSLFSPPRLFPAASISVTHTCSRTRQHNSSLCTHTPSRLKGEPGGVSPISAQGAERPHDEFEAGVVDVPQVDVLMGDLHGALAVDVQVGRGHQVHVETFCKIDKMNICLLRFLSLKSHKH